MPASVPDSIEFGVIVKPHGVRGAVTIACSAAHRDVLAPGVTVVLRGGPAVRELTVQSIGGTDARPIVTFAGISTRNDAEELRSLHLCASRDQLAALDDDEYYFADLVGCDVVIDSERGDTDDESAIIGRVREVKTMPTQELLIVARIEGAGGEILVPFTRHAVPVVDIEARQIAINRTFVDDVAETRGEA